MWIISSNKERIFIQNIKVRIEKELTLPFKAIFQLFELNRNKYMRRNQIITFEIMFFISAQLLIYKVWKNWIKNICFHLLMFLFVFVCTFDSDCCVSYRSLFSTFFCSVFSKFFSFLLEETFYVGKSQLFI